jgi:hypothetical protein
MAARLGYLRVRKIEGMGGGDVKLAAMLAPCSAGADAADAVPLGGRRFHLGHRAHGAKQGGG